MKPIKYIQHIFLTLVVFSSFLSASEDFNITESKDWVILPYVFSSDSTGLAGGIGVIKQGLFQPQTTLTASIMGGATQDIIVNGQAEEANFSGYFFAFSDYKLPFTNRLFFSFLGFKSYYPSKTNYLDGSHTSSKDDVLTTSGNSNFFNTTFRYVLPLGEGLDNPERLYRLQDGFAQEREGYGGGAPFVTGTTSLGIKTFYQYDDYENWQDYEPWQSISSVPSWDTNGLRLFLTHDNTDFDLNPSRGYHFQAQYSKDFGEGDSLQSWDFLEFKYNHYFNLDTFSFTQQNVLALSLWTGYSFSWDNDKEISPGIDAHRPPPWEGARLGGYNRMRAYDNNRFSDKASFYATAEYRAVLDYNPLKKNSLIPVAVDWFQVVAFVEAGRVHDKYNLDLLTDMKYDVGLSLRAMAAQVPIRLDVAYGDEGTNFWVMIQQPFDF
ncbi:MAG: hypothetical protein DRQ78_00395 [Epsilonproteobacteria bacterium]|nr:MAG: hypothetical protein DRQ78_00395 [Campylobacterota bacterium]